MKQLTKHFSVEEYANSDTALRMGIKNVPPADVMENMTRNAETLELIRMALSYKAGKEVSIHIQSGYRCEDLEKIVARADYLAWCRHHHLDDEIGSWRAYFIRKGHPEGNCADIVAPAFGSPLEIVRFISSRPEIMQHIDQIICEGTWVHVATADKPRGQVMTATFNSKGIPTYTEGVA